MKKYITWTAGAATLRVESDGNDDVDELISKIQLTGATVICVRSTTVIGSMECGLDDAQALVEQGWNWK
jgi:hypothetical protein